MTNKDTERLVQQTMQQTIPDKDALWAKIESGLPQQPEFREIRRSAGNMRRIYRVMSAAACFLLVAGGVGIWRSLSFSKSANFTQNANVMMEGAPQQNRQKEAAGDEGGIVMEGVPPQYYRQKDAACDEEARAAADACDDNRQEAAPCVPGDNAANSGQSELSADEPLDSVILSGTIYGDACAVQADVQLLTETQEILDAGYIYLLKTEPDVEEARRNGILLGFDLNGQEILLASYQESDMMIADGKAYAVPETGRTLLDSLPKGH